MIPTYKNVTAYDAHVTDYAPVLAHQWDDDDDLNAQITNVRDVYNLGGEVIITEDITHGA